MNCEVLKHLVLYAKGLTYEVSKSKEMTFVERNSKIIGTIVNNTMIVGGDLHDKPSITKVILNQLSQVNDGGKARQELVDVMCGVIGGYNLGVPVGTSNYDTTMNSLFYILKYIPVEDLPFDIDKVECSNTLYDIIKSI